VLLKVAVVYWGPQFTKCAVYYWDQTADPYSDMDGYIMGGTYTRICTVHVEWWVGVNCRPCSYLKIGLAS
jgi:hypothetical protein